MARLSITLEGGPKLRAALKRLNPGSNFRILSKSLIEIAGDIADNAKEVQLLKGGGPPTDPPTKLTNRSHRLYDSIGVDFKPLPDAIEVGTEVIYAGRHEHGLSGMPKRAFMLPALDAVRPRIPEIIVRHWKREARV